MRKSLRTLLVFAAGFVVCVAFFVLVRSMIDDGDNKFLVYHMDSRGRMNHAVMFVVSGVYDSSIYRLQVWGSAERMDSPQAETCLVNAATGEMEVSFLGGHDNAKVFQGRVFVETASVDENVLCVRGVLIGSTNDVGRLKPSQVEERIYIIGQFGKHPCGMGYLRWRVISLLEALLGVPA